MHNKIKSVYKLVIIKILFFYIKYFLQKEKKGYYICKILYHWKKIFISIHPFQKSIFSISTYFGKFFLPISIDLITATRSKLKTRLSYFSQSFVHDYLL